MIANPYMGQEYPNFFLVMGISRPSIFPDMGIKCPNIFPDMDFSLPKNSPRWDFSVPNIIWYGVLMSQKNVNPLRQIIVKAVLDGMNIMEDSGASVKTFEDILDYGKKMLFTSVGDDIDVDILSTLWPKNWNAAQLLLKQEGFSDAKECYICICRESKEMTRNGKTTTKYQYSRSWSILESLIYVLIVVNLDT